MKTLKKGDEIVRKDNETAEEMVKNQGWKYCKKELWKKLRGPVAKQVEVEKHPDQPWKDKRRRKDEVKIVDGAIAKEEIKKEITAADIMAGGDRVMKQAMEITGQEDKKGKKKGKK
jgi:hypothetical protein